MSGGVDSSVALILLKNSGWQPIGVSLKYAVWDDKENTSRENICCSAASFAVAKKICDQLGVAHHIIDVSGDFRKEVIDYFTSALKRHETPNPCIVCNPRLKFKELFDWAHNHNIQYVATGHYAYIQKNKKIKKQKNNFLLLTAKDKEKDQTYSLAFLPQVYLKNIIFPLGGYTKKKVYQLAKKYGLNFFEKIKQSQDFCFVAGKSMPRFLSQEIGEKVGLIQDKEGNILGEHPGLHFYTIGQRKRIKLPGGPWFVIRFNVKENILVVSQDEKDLYQQAAILSPVHFISNQTPTRPLKIKAKIRYSHKPARATLYQLDGNKFKIVFNQPQKSITPGQYAVFYQGRVCPGGGRITDISI